MITIWPILFILVGCGARSLEKESDILDAIGNVGIDNRTTEFTENHARFVPLHELQSENEELRKNSLKYLFGLYNRTAAFGGNTGFTILRKDFDVDRRVSDRYRLIQQSQFQLGLVCPGGNCAQYLFPISLNALNLSQRNARRYDFFYAPTVPKREYCKRHQCLTEAWEQFAFDLKAAEGENTIKREALVRNIEPSSANGIFAQPGKETSIQWRIVVSNEIMSCTTKALTSGCKFAINGTTDACESAERCIWKKGRPKGRIVAISPSPKDFSKFLTRLLGVVTKSTTEASVWTNVNRAQMFWENHVDPSTLTVYVTAVVATLFTLFGAISGARLERSVELVGNEKKSRWKFLKHWIAVTLAVFGSVAAVLTGFVTEYRYRTWESGVLFALTQVRVDDVFSDTPLLVSPLEGNPPSLFAYYGIGIQEETYRTLKDLFIPYAIAFALYLLLAGIVIVWYTIQTRKILNPSSDQELPDLLSTKEVSASPPGEGADA